MNFKKSDKFICLNKYLLVNDIYKDDKSYIDNVADKWSKPRLNKSSILGGGITSSMNNLLPQNFASTSLI